MVSAKSVHLTLTNAQQNKGGHLKAKQTLSSLKGTSELLVALGEPMNPFGFLYS